MSREWSDDYLLGISVIDEQHKGFFDASQKLYDDMLNVQGEESVEATVEFLREYAKTHFQTEEAFMQKHAYPRLEEHKQLHRDFFEGLDQLSEDLDVFGPTQHLAERALEISRDWLLEHILEEDTQYARHIEA
jgi:hemerythrin